MLWLAWAFVNFISCKVFYNQPTGGECVRTLHSPIGSLWSHALFLIPLRTCFIAFSPHPASDQAQITGKLVVLDCLIFTLERETEGFQRFHLFILSHTMNVSTGVWMLARCSQDFGQKRADVLSFRWFPPRHPGWHGCYSFSEVNCIDEVRWC